MAANDIIARLGGWEGYFLDGGWEEQRGQRKWCVLRLEPRAGWRRCCSGCGELTTAIHDREERRVRDLPLFEVPVELRVPRLRLNCRSVVTMAGDPVVNCCPARLGVSSLPGPAVDGAGGQASEVITNRAFAQVQLARDSALGLALRGQCLDRHA